MSGSKTVIEVKVSGGAESACGAILGGISGFMLGGYGGYLIAEYATGLYLPGLPFIAKGVVDAVGIFYGVKAGGTVGATTGAIGGTITGAVAVAASHYADRVYANVLKKEALDAPKCVREKPFSVEFVREGH